jgi:ribosome-binding protein aMBF1 (putative translation factor)
MARKTLQEKLAEQKAVVEQLEKEMATLKGQLAADPGPLVLTVSVNRRTGRYVPATTVDQGNPEPDVRLLLQVVRQVEWKLSDELVRLTEQRIRSEVEQKEASQEELNAP